MKSRLRALITCSAGVERMVKRELESPGGMRAYNEALLGLVCDSTRGCSAVQLADDKNRTAALTMGTLYVGYNETYVVYITHLKTHQIDIAKDKGSKDNISILALKF